MGKMKWVRRPNGCKPGTLVIRNDDCPYCGGFAGHFEGDNFVECGRCWGTGHELA